MLAVAVDLAGTGWCLGLLGLSGRPVTVYAPIGLQPFLPETVQVLRQHSEQRIDASQEKLLCQVSPATIDRLLKSCRS